MMKHRGPKPIVQCGLSADAAYSSSIVSSGKTSVLQCSLSVSAQFLCVHNTNAVSLYCTCDLHIYISARFTNTHTDNTLTYRKHESMTKEDVWNDSTISNNKFLSVIINVSLTSRWVWQKCYTICSQKYCFSSPLNTYKCIPHIFFLKEQFT